MLMDWLFSKLGMLLLLLVFLEVLSEGYSTYSYYNAHREAEALAENIADDITEAATAVPHYSVLGGYQKHVALPEGVHGAPYLLVFDVDEHLIEIVLPGETKKEKVSARAFLPLEGLNSVVFAGFEDDGNGRSSVFVERQLELKITKESGGLKISLGGA